MTSPQHDKARMDRTWEIYQDLIRLIVDRGESLGDVRFDSDMLTVLYEASDADREAFTRLVAAHKALRATYLTAADVAAQWGISERLVQRLAQSRALQGYKRGGKWLFTPKAIERYVAAHTYSGGLRVDFPAGESDELPEADLLSRARAELGGLEWRSGDLAGFLGVSLDRAYRLMLAWHAAGVVDHAEKRGWYHFAGQAELSAASMAADSAIG